MAYCSTPDRSVMSLVTLSDVGDAYQEPRVSKRGRGGGRGLAKTISK